MLERVKLEWGKMVAYLPKVLVAFIIFLGFWFIGVLLKKVIKRFGKKAKIDPEIVFLLGKLALWGFVIIGFITSLGTLGINIGALIASLGLTGFALGFALKDMLANFIAGILILVYKPFEVGNKIAVAGMEGVVKEIDLRYTTLENKEKLVLIPNSMMLSKAVIVEKEKV